MLEGGVESVRVVRVVTRVKVVKVISGCKFCCNFNKVKNCLLKVLYISTDKLREYFFRSHATPFTPCLLPLLSKSRIICKGVVPKNCWIC